MSTEWRNMHHPPSLPVSLRPMNHSVSCNAVCCRMNGIHTLERHHNWTKLRSGTLKQTLPRDWTHAQHVAHQLYRSDCLLCTWGFNCHVTNSTSNDILKSFDSTYSKELAPNAGAVCSLRLLSFTLQFGKRSPKNGAQAPKMSGQPPWRHTPYFNCAFVGTIKCDTKNTRCRKLQDWK